MSGEYTGPALASLVRSIGELAATIQLHGWDSPTLQTSTAGAAIVSRVTLVGPTMVRSAPRVLRRASAGLGGLDGTAYDSTVVRFSIVRTVRAGAPAGSSLLFAHDVLGEGW